MAKGQQRNNREKKKPKADKSKKAASVPSPFATPLKFTRNAPGKK
jgi:hypothetical protein